MATTFELIESYTATGTVASVTIGSGGTIPQTFTDLKVVWSIRTPSTAPTYDNLIIRLNGSTANGSVRTLLGVGSGTPSSYSDTSTYVGAGTVGSAATANTFSNGELYIPNYRGSQSKSMSVDTVTENNATAAAATINALLWADSAAVTSIQFVPNFANFAQYSSFYLYGVKNA